MIQIIIRVVDIETTGLEPREHSVCEIGFCDVVSERIDLAGDPISWTVKNGFAIPVYPGRPIPPEASAIHHIVDDDVREALPWPTAALPILQAQALVAFAAHNAKFERQWIDPHIAYRPVICSYKAALRLWPEAPAHGCQALRYWRRPEGLDRTIATPAHCAYWDAYTAAHLLRDMLNEGARVWELIEWSSQPALQVTCQIGEWRGCPWSEVDEGFLHWILRKDFDEDVVFTVETELKRRRDLECSQTDLF